MKTIRRYVRSLGHRGSFDTFLGLRHDEPERVAKKKAANQTVAANRKEPELYEMPLNDMRVGKPQVRAFWDAQAFDLAIPDGMGNCDLCFMKGEGNLVWLIRNDMERAKDTGAVSTLADDWLEMEKIVSGKSGRKVKRDSQFNKKWSYNDLVKIAKNQSFIPQWSDHYQIDCSCGS